MEKLIRRIVRGIVKLWKRNRDFHRDFEFDEF